MRVPGRGFLSRWARLLVCLLPAKAGAQAELPWPLELDRALSSTFGETRPAAFHAGIDLKTQGKTGFPVRAPAPGYVLRARTSPWGFGRSLYQKLPDGRILVYAHLQGFAAPIAQRISQAQRARQTYTVDLEFPPGEIPLAQGQVIAWTGDSGIGPPHLHLEVRDADNVPLNPLREGFRVADTRPPVFERLALTPVGIESRVDGGHLPLCIALKDGEATAVPLVSGRFGVSAQLYDLADAAANQLAPYRVGLEVDGRPLVAATYGRVAYTEGHQVFLDRARLEFPGGSGVFFNLFRLEGNRLEFYDLPPGTDGLLRCGPAQGQLGPGLHTLVLTAEDVAGNQAQARLQVKVAEPPPVHCRPWYEGETSEAAFTLDYLAFPDFAEVRARADRPLSLAPPLVLADAQRLDTLDLEQIGPREFRASLPLTAAGPLTLRLAGRSSPVLALSQAPVTPAEETLVEWGGGEAWLRVPAGAAYAPLFPQARRFDPPAAEGLIPAGIGYEFLPAGQSFDHLVEIGLRYGPEVKDSGKLGLYQEQSKGKWAFVDRQLDTENRLVSGKVRRLLRFALFSDSRSPVLSSLQPAAGSTIAERQPLLRAGVDDIGSGIGREEDLDLRLDGQRLIAEYDPEAGTLSARPEAPLKPGGHLLEVEVRDQSGNQARARAEFSVR